MMYNNRIKAIKGMATAGQIKRGLMFANITEVELDWKAVLIVSLKKLTFVLGVVELYLLKLKALY